MEPKGSKSEVIAAIAGMSDRDKILAYSELIGLGLARDVLFRAMEEITAGRDPLAKRGGRPKKPVHALLELKVALDAVHADRERIHALAATHGVDPIDEALGVAAAWFMHVSGDDEQDRHALALRTGEWQRHRALVEAALRPEEHWSAWRTLQRSGIVPKNLSLAAAKGRARRSGWSPTRAGHEILSVLREHGPGPITAAIFKQLNDQIEQKQSAKRTPTKPNVAITRRVRSR